jgi:hypothetical protein
MAAPLADPATRTRAGAFLVAQLGALVAILGGVLLLWGVAVTLIVGGALVLAGSILVEWLATRPGSS